MKPVKQTMIHYADVVMYSDGDSCTIEINDQKSNRFVSKSFATNEEASAASERVVSQGQVFQDLGDGLDEESQWGRIQAALNQ